MLRDIAQQRSTLGCRVAQEMHHMTMKQLRQLAHPREETQPTSMRRSARPSRATSWPTDEEYEAPPPPPEPDEEDLAARLAETCTPSSDILTFIPDDFGERPTRRRQPTDERS